MKYKPVFLKDFYGHLGKYSKKMMIIQKKMIKGFDLLVAPKDNLLARRKLNTLKMLSALLTARNLGSFTSAAIERISGFVPRMITSLAFQMHPISKKTLEKFLRLTPKLKYLSMFNNEALDGFTWHALRFAKYLEALRITKAPLIGKILVNPLRFLFKLRFLHLSSLPLDEENKILKAIFSLSQLERINISKSSLDCTSAKLIAERLDKMTSLKSLRLSYNENLGEEGVLAILEKIPKNKTIKRLELTGHSLAPLKNPHFFLKEIIEQNNMLVELTLDAILPWRFTHAHGVQWNIEKKCYLYENGEVMVEEQVQPFSLAFKENHSNIEVISLKHYNLTKEDRDFFKSAWFNTHNKLLRAVRYTAGKEEYNALDSKPFCKLF